MTLRRVDSVRVARPLFQAERGGSTPTSTLQLLFSTCSEEIFRSCNRAWHSQLPLVGNNHFRVCYSAEHDGIVYAVAAWSNPVARLLPQQTWLELRRFAIAPDRPKNTASRMIGWMVRDIRKRFPDVERLISYQDLDAHVGTIYRAAGWQQATDYVSRRRGWKPTTRWASRHRAGRTNQKVAPRMRWEKVLVSND